MLTSIESSEAGENQFLHKAARERDFPDGALEGHGMCAHTEYAPRAISISLQATVPGRI